MFVWQDIDAAYLFQDMGDIDDDLSSLLVPDLDFSSIATFPEPSVPKIPQTGAQVLVSPFLDVFCCAMMIAMPQLLAPKRSHPNLLM